MRRLWEFNVVASHIAFTREYIAVASKSRLLCFTREGLLWKKRMTATFYRDPYGDVSITALDAEYPYIAVGTNFMDGKVYLFTVGGKLCWEHQFATTASLGWRPEDVTAVKIGGGVVCAGTEFMNEYVYVYTTERKRVFQLRVGGRVRDFLLVPGRIIIGTENNLYMVTREGEILQALELPALALSRWGEKLVVIGGGEITVFEIRGSELVKVWSHPHTSTALPKICWCKEGLLVGFGNCLKCFSEDGRLRWERSFDGEIVGIHYDAGIYVGLRNRILVLRNGEVEVMEVDGIPVKFGEGTVIVQGRGVILYDYTE